MVVAAGAGETGRRRRWRWRWRWRRRYLCASVASGRLPRGGRGETERKRDRATPCRDVEVRLWGWHSKTTGAVETPWILPVPFAGRIGPADDVHRILNNTGAHSGNERTGRSRWPPPAPGGSAAARTLHLWFRHTADGWWLLVTGGKRLGTISPGRLIRNRNNETKRNEAGGRQAGGGGGGLPEDVRGGNDSWTRTHRRRRRR